MIQELNNSELKTVNGGFNQAAADEGYRAGAIVRKAFGLYGLWKFFV